MLTMLLGLASVAATLSVLWAIGVSAHAIAFGRHRVSDFSVPVCVLSGGVLLAAGMFLGGICYAVGCAVRQLLSGV